MVSSAAVLRLSIREEVLLLDRVAAETWFSLSLEVSAVVDLDCTGVVVDLDAVLRGRLPERIEHDPSTRKE